MSIPYSPLNVSIPVTMRVDPPTKYDFSHIKTNVDAVNCAEFALTLLAVRGLLSSAYIELMDKAIKHARTNAEYMDQLEASFKPIIGGIYNDLDYPLHVRVTTGSWVLDKDAYYSLEDLAAGVLSHEEAASNQPPTWKPTNFRFVKDTKAKATWVDYDEEAVK